MATDDHGTNFTSISHLAQMDPPSFPTPNPPQPVSGLPASFALI